MGKTRTKLIDDSISRTEEKKPKVKKEPAKALADTQPEPKVKESKSEVQKESSKVAAQVTEPVKPQAKKKQSATKAKKVRGQKYQKKTEGLDRSKAYSISEAVDTVKNLSYSKFNGTLEIHINTTQTGLRGLASLPYASGKKLRILAFGKGAEISGAGIVGEDSTLDQINQGKINFDLVVTTPDWMPKLAKVARVLGPRGLMPNPKNGTITSDLKKAVEGFQAGKTEYKTEPKAPIIHLGLGKLDQPTEELTANVKALLVILGKTKIKRVYLSPTMGPSVRIDLGTI